MLARNRQIMSLTRQMVLPNRTRLTRVGHRSSHYRSVTLWPSDQLVVGIVALYALIIPMIRVSAKRRFCIRLLL